MNTHKSERGQAMVLIILSIVGIFAFAALAVDLGQMFSARRSAQSAADAAALGTAYDAVAGSMDQQTALNLGYDLAAANGYDNNWENNWVEINNPPVGGPYCDICNDIAGIEYYQARITVHLRPIFAQLFYKGAEEVTVEAVAHAKTFDSATAGDAILSQNRTDLNSILFDGNTKVHVDGGNIRSSGGMTKNGGGSGSITATNGGSIYYAMDEGFKGSSNPINPKPEMDSAYTIGGMKDPTCPTAVQAAGWETVDGVKHKVIADPDGNDVDYWYYSGDLSVSNLPKGIHCIHGGVPKGNFVGHGVLLVLQTGGIKQNGGDSIDFRAATDLKDANGTQWGGMAIYVPYGNTSEIYFGGNTEAYIQGVIYAPDAFCDIGGNPDGVAYHTAFICNKFKFHGTPTVEILFNAAELFHFPPMVELVQ